MMSDEKLLDMIKRELKARKVRQKRFETLREKARREKLVKTIVEKLRPKL